MLPRDRRMNSSKPRVCEGREMLLDLPFFQELDHSIQAQLPDVTRLSTMRRGSVIFREDDSAECCYIILSGRVTLSESQREGSVDDGRGAVSRSSPPCSSPASTCSTIASASQRLSSSSRPSSRPLSGASSRAASPRDVIQQAAKQLSSTRSDAAKKANGDVFASKDGVTLGPGRLFGDFALLHSRPRSFTATCKQDCEMLVVEKHDFDRLLRPTLQQVRQEKLAFLASYLPGMSDLPEHKAELVLHRFQKRTFQKGELVHAQGPTSKKFLCIVIKGSVFVSHHHGGDAVIPSEIRGSQMRGDVFGSLDERTAQPCTVLSTSACEVYFAEHRDLHALTPCIKQSTLRHLLRIAISSSCWDGGRSSSSRWDHVPQFTDISAQPRRRPSTAGMLTKPSMLRQEDTNNQSQLSPPKATARSSSLPSLRRNAGGQQASCSRRQRSQANSRGLR